MAAEAEVQRQRAAELALAWQTAHAAFVRQAYSEAASLYGALLARDLTPAERCSTLCNRAAAYAAMDLNRKVIGDTDAAVALDGACLRALLLKGSALQAMGRTDDAQRVWRQGASTSGPADVLMVAELSRLANGAPAGAALTTAPVASVAPVPVPVPVAGPVARPSSAPAPPAAQPTCAQRRGSPRRAQTPPCSEGSW